MRLFIGVSLPNHVTDVIDSFKEAYVQYDLDKLEARWVPKNNFHITLLFLGEADSYKLDQVLEVVEKVAKNLNSFQAKTGGLTILSNFKYPKVLALEIKENKNLSALQKALLDEFNKKDYVFENKKFVPHITLGRFKRRVRDLKSTLKELREPPEQEFEISSFEVLETSYSNGEIKYLLHKRIKFG